MIGNFGELSLLVMAVLVCAGGIVGFLKHASKPSLIAGVVSAALLAASYFEAIQNKQLGMSMGLAVCGLLCVIFSMRLKKSKAFFPSGLMLLLSAIEVILLSTLMFMM